MEVENQLSMSLDDIINKHKKERPVGNKKQQVLEQRLNSLTCEVLPCCAIVAWGGNISLPVSGQIPYTSSDNESQVFWC